MTEATTATAEAAITDLLMSARVDTHGNSQQSNVLGGNIFGPQLAIGTGNSSVNSTAGNTAVGNGNGFTTTSETFIVGMVSCNGLTICAGTGHGNTFQITVLGNNIYDPQFSIGGSNTSLNNTRSNLAEENGNGSWSTAQTRSALLGGLFGPPIGNGNTTQINILSANIVNTQIALGGDNISANSTNGNISRRNGNDSRATVAMTDQTIMAAGAAFGQMIGNGNTVQINILSNNIINTQFTLGGSNISADTASGNIAASNGNHSFISVTTHYEGTKIFGNGLFAVVLGTGNTIQIDILSNNVVNIQLALHGPDINTRRTNSSTNSTVANNTSDNGNGSETTVDSQPGGTSLTGTTATGNGNSQQTAVLAGNITNPQNNIGSGPVTDQSSTQSVATGQRGRTAMSDAVAMSHRGQKTAAVTLIPPTPPTPPVEPVAPTPPTPPAAIQRGSAVGAAAALDSDGGPQRARSTQGVRKTA